MALATWPLSPAVLSAAETTVELSSLVGKSTLLAPLDESQEIGVALALPLSNPRGAADYIQRISRKGDPLYHHYLTPQQFAERFGGDARDYAALKQWAISSGLVISQESVGRLNLTVRGSVSQFEKIFNTRINRYRAPDGSEFYSASIKPTVPIAIATKISGVIGLTGGKQYAPLLKVAKRLGESPVSVSSGNDKGSAAGTGPGGTYSAKDLRTAYNIPAFGNLSNNTVVAVFEQGGFTPSDVSEYLDTNDLPHVKITAVSVDNSPTTVNYAGIELEAVLDVDMVISINPNVDEVRVYEDSVDTFQTALLDAITQVGDENKAQVLSISYGQDEGYQGNDAIAAENTALQQLATEGITVTASSGDNGAYGDGYNTPYNVYDPASQPYITGVGGTSLYTGIGHAYVVEEAWNDLVLQDGATGGGISSYWSIPSYQSSEAPGYMTGNGGSSTMRNVPDVAAVGDPFTGVGIYSKINGGWILIGGTSVSSPIWAGYLSIINAGFEYSGLHNLGFFNPPLYSVGTPSYENANPSDFLYPVAVGSNGYPGTTYPGYSNGFGYCNTTGNGSLWGSGFATQLMISGTASGNTPAVIQSLVQGKTTDTSVTLKWTTSTGQSAYVVGIYYAGSYGTVSQAFVTKDTAITLPDLVKGGQYTAYVWPFNQSGGSQQPAGPVNFSPGIPDGGSGIEERVLTPMPDPIDREAFGSAIALSGKTLVVGEPLQTIDNQEYVGAAYVYLEPTQGWGSDTPAKVAQLTASDGLKNQWPELGGGVAISGDTIAVYGNYATYVYIKPVGGWTSATENARLQAPNGYTFDGQTTDFGYIAMDGDTIVANVYNFNQPQGQVGGAAVYVKPAGGWTGDIQPVAVLTDGQFDDGLGQYIAISGDTIVLGARGATVGGFADAGTVYVYEKPGSGWTTTSTPSATLVASDPSVNAYLGYGVGLSGDTIVTGVPFAIDKHSNDGAVYVFVRNGAHWRSGTQTAKLATPGAGSDVAIHGDMIVAGADGVTPPDGAPFGGEVFFYRKPSGGWRNTSKADGVLYDPGEPALFGLGVSVAVENGTIVAGAQVNNGFGDTPGAVCIFRPH